MPLLAFLRGRVCESLCRHLICSYLLLCFAPLAECSGMDALAGVLHQKASLSLKSASAAEVPASSEASVAELVPVPVDAIPSSGDAVFERLKTWMQLNSDQLLPAASQSENPRLDDAIEVRNTNGDRALVAKRKMRPGELLFRLPVALLMHAGYYKVLNPSTDARTDSVTTALHHSLSSEGLYDSSKVILQTWLAIYLMEQRRLGSASAWSPYMESLPTQFSSHPVFFTEEDWDMLKGSKFRDYLNSVVESWREQFDIVGQLVAGFKQNYTFEDFKWARVTISSRVFDCSGIRGVSSLMSKGSNRCMMPLVDLINHRVPHHIEFELNERLQTMDLTVVKGASAGQELFLDYGDKNNSHHMLYYGFALPDVERSLNTIALGLELSDDDRQLLHKRLQSSGATIPSHEWMDSLDFPAEMRSDFPRMLGYARVLSLPANDDFEQRLQSRGCHIPSQGPPRCDNPIAVENEKSALNRCLKAFEDAIQKYPTGLEDDESLIKEGRLQGKSLFIVLLRRDEKTILHWWINFLKVTLGIVDLSADEVLPAAEKEFPWVQSDMGAQWFFHMLKSLVEKEKAEL